MTRALTRFVACAVTLFGIVGAARPAAAQPAGGFESPGNGSTVAQPFLLSGYLIDTEGTTGTGVDQLHVYACPIASCYSWTYWGQATYGLSRPDIATYYGDSRFTNSGFQILVTGQPGQQYLIHGWAHSTVWDYWFLVQYVLTVTPNVTNPQGAVEAPVSNQPVGQPFSFSGWTIDAGNPGPGVDAVYVYQCLYDNCPTWNSIGTATYGAARTDIASTYGSTFLNSGYSKTVSGLAEGHYYLIQYAHRTLDDGWTVAWSTPYVYASNPTLTIDRPGAGTGGVTATGLTCTGGSGTQAVPCSALYAFNTAVTLTAVPDSGSIFAGWTGTCSGTSTCAVTMTESKYVAARFVPAAGSSALTFYHTDTIGSVRALTDGSGSTIIRHDYGAFGEDTASMTGDPIRFGGKELDPETALQNFEARYYRQTWGRFSAVDPVSGWASDPQSWNRYAYARNNPLRYVDPTGLSYDVFVPGGSPFSLPDDEFWSLSLWYPFEPDPKGDRYGSGRMEDKSSHLLLATWQYWCDDCSDDAYARGRANLRQGSEGGGVGAVSTTVTTTRPPCDPLCGLVSTIGDTTSPAADPKVITGFLAVSALAGAAGAVAAAPATHAAVTAVHNHMLTVATSAAAVNYERFVRLMDVINQLEPGPTMPETLTGFRFALWGVLSEGYEALRDSILHQPQPRR